MADIVKYTVQFGDTLSEIARDHCKNKLYPNEWYSCNDIWGIVDALCEINNIKNENLIYAADVLTLNGPPPGKTVNSTYRAKITKFGVLLNEPNKLSAEWEWDKSDTKGFQVRWMYKEASGKDYRYGSSTMVSYSEEDPDSSKYSTYDIPEKAFIVKFQVKPLCSLEKKNKKYWEADWSTEKTYSVYPTPSVPELQVDEVSSNDIKLYFTAESKCSYGSTSPYEIWSIQFQLVVGTKYTDNYFTKELSDINTAKVVITKGIKSDAKHYVRCRLKVQHTLFGNILKTSYGPWSELSEPLLGRPSKPEGFTEWKATSETSVYLKWNSIAGVKHTYNIQYTDDPDNFDVSPDDVTEVTNIESNSRKIVDLESGKEYFFRLQAVGSDGAKSPWSTNIKSVIIGTKPGVPTTWSSSTTAIRGEDITLNWIHNSQDSSDITKAYLVVYNSANPDQALSTEIDYQDNDEEENINSKSYSLDTTWWLSDVQLRWKVKTAGITGEYSDYSIERYIDLYDKPSLELSVSNALDNGLIDTLTSFPLYISAVTYPVTQHPIGYHLNITSNDSYETVDNAGNPKNINAGEVVFSKYYDTNANLSDIISAGDVDFKNNMTYTITVIAAMDSGLEAEYSTDIKIAWDEDFEYWPTANITIDHDSLTANITPFCIDNDASLVEDVLLSVYRRESDGSFTEIASDIENTSSIGIVDPHPSLDYARYRIVATNKITGSITYYDRPGYYIGESSIVLQWDEVHSEFDINDDDTVALPTYSGSMLKLPYNIDISDSYTPDVSLIEYIGRENPVSYYGTQRGVASTWKVDIPKDDIETLYAIRRLAKWMGNVYVREPSGSGYWANVVVSYNVDHDKLIIPVTFDIKKVEGGM